MDVPFAFAINNFVPLCTVLYVCIYIHIYIYIYIYVYMYMYVYMYACMYVCTYVRTYVCMYACVYTCIYVCMYPYAYIFMYVYTHMYVLCMYIYTPGAPATCTNGLRVCNWSVGAQALYVYVTKFQGYVRGSPSRGLCSDSPLRAPHVLTSSARC